MTVPESFSCNQGFRGVIRVSFGRADSLATERINAQPPHDFHFASADPGTLSVLRSAIELACVGVRLILTGPMTDIKVAAAVAAECGLVEEEITLVSNGSEYLSVYCPHCRTINTTAEPIGSEVECRGCATVLSITNHSSRRIAAYLGYAAHAEETA